MEAILERVLARVTPRREAAQVWEFELNFFSKRWKHSTHDEMRLILFLKFCEINDKHFCAFSGQVIFDYLRLNCAKKTTFFRGGDSFQKSWIYHMHIFARGVGPTTWSYFALVFFRLPEICDRMIIKLPLFNFDFDCLFLVFQDFDFCFVMIVVGLVESTNSSTKNWRQSQG